MATRKKWPKNWTPLDEIYAQREWTLQEAQVVSRAERPYAIWVHWHEERVMTADAQSELRNWCPLCPASWGDTRFRFQVPPEFRPFNNMREALDRLENWIRKQASGSWLLSPQMVDDLPIRPHTRLVRGVPHTTLGRLIEQLASEKPQGLKFCGHTQSLEYSLMNPAPTFAPWWCVATDTEALCPFCNLGLPAWSPQVLRTDSLPEDIHAPDNGELWQVCA